MQIAYYEAHGIEGLIAYKNTLKYLKDNNLISIADVKEETSQIQQKNMQKHILKVILKLTL